MTRYHCVTTTNEAGWRETGHRMAASFVSRWPASARLTVYAEGFEPETPGIEARSLPSWLDEFKAEHAGHDGRQRGVKPYDYRFDAVKFAHKSAAMTDFAFGIGSGIMIWLDADTFTHADVDEAWLDGLFPRAAYIAWLERKGSHPETGFVMFRADHPQHHAIMGELEDLYVSGRLFEVGETHDAALLHRVVTRAAARGEISPPHNLSGAATNWHHPFVEVLGSRLDHMKGPRKAEGRSRKRDLRAPRHEPYWQF